jgi:bacterial/archaeal transporter family protein
MASATTSPATEPGRHHDHYTDDDDDDNDDEAFHRESSIHALRGARSRRSSLTVLTSRALAVQGDVTRSIGGRLGGHFDSVRSPLDLKVDGSIRGERTPLMLHSPATALKGSIDIIGTITSPPLKLWIAPALACAGAYAFYNIFIKKGSCCVHPLLGAVILQFVAALLGSVLLGVIVWNEVGAEIHYDKVGLFWSMCAGLAVGSAEMLSFFVSSLGVQASQFIPIIIGGSVMFGAVLGMILLGETMMFHGWSGIALLVTGIALVATDPGVKVEEGGVGSTVELSDDENEPPPLVVWIGPALVCAICYAFYNIFIKKGSASINPILGGVVLQFVAAIFGSTLLLGTAMVEGFEGLTVTGTGLLWACCAGVSVGTAELLSFAVSGMGVDASKSIPVIIGGSVMFGAVLGLLLLGETLMVQGWGGVALLMVGIAMVATDPGEKVAGH